MKWIYMVPMAGLVAASLLAACEPIMTPATNAGAIASADTPRSPAAASTSALSGFPAGVPDSYTLADVEITRDQPGCLGPCPDYSINIAGDGRVIYQGRESVEVIGRRERRLSHEQVVELLRAFYDADFFRLADSYSEDLGMEVGDGGTVTHVVGMDSEFPSQSLTLRIGTYEKRVVHQGYAPEALHDLEDTIDADTGAWEWVGGARVDSTPTVPPMIPSILPGFNATVTALWAQIEATPTP